MIPRVQSAIDVKQAVERASRNLTEIGFDASVLKDGYETIRRDLALYIGRHSPDETDSGASGDVIIDKKQMVRHLSNDRVHV